MVSSQRTFRVFFFKNIFLLALKKLPHNLIKRFFLFIAACVLTESSRFVALPQSQTVVEGESVLFECSATPIDLEFSWTLNGKH